MPDPIKEDGRKDELIDEESLNQETEESNPEQEKED